jgi:membrane-associated protein
MPELVAGVLDGLAGLNTTALYLMAGMFTALETSAGIGLLIPGDGVILLAGTTATTPHRFAALVAVTVLGSLAGESVGYLLARRYRCGSGPAGRVGGWVRTGGSPPRRSWPAAVVGRWPRPVSWPWCMRWCRCWPAPSAGLTGGWSAGVR